MEDRIEEVFASEITRADFLKRAAATGVGLSLLSGVIAWMTLEHKHRKA